MAQLARSLVNLRGEIDDRWPGRDRRTDGWYADPRVRVSYGHNPDPAGWVHAIDVDKDGISPTWIIDHVYRGGGVLWYIIWNRGIWSMDHGWRRLAYSGTNPHTDHMHIEIRHTATARGYNGHWGIQVSASLPMPAPRPPSDWGAADLSPEVKGSGRYMANAGDNAARYATAIKQLRR